MKTTEGTESRELYNHPLSRKVIGCAIEVHRQLGPGLLESAYQQCLALELSQADLSFNIEMPMPVYYKGTNLNCGYRIDLLVENFLVVELKAVEHISKLHQAQLLTYMKLAEAPIGLILNFNVTRLKDGIRKFVL